MSATGEPGSGWRVRATLRQPQLRKAACAGAAAGRTASVARSSGRWRRIRSCRAPPIPWRRHDAQDQQLGHLERAARVLGRDLVRHRGGQVPPTRR